MCNKVNFPLPLSTREASISFNFLLLGGMEIEISSNFFLVDLRFGLFLNQELLDSILKLKV